MALSPKHQEFINQYIACYFNGTEAYKRVYPNVTKETAWTNSSRLLSTAKVAEEVKRRVAERTMGADEVLILLADHARADIRDFLAVSNNGDVALDISAAEGKTHLIKKVTQRHSTRSKKDEVTEETVLTLELHDAQAALVHIGKHHGLFKDSVEHSGETIIKVIYGDERTNDSAT